MPPGFSGNLIFAIIARMLCGNHLNHRSGGEQCGLAWSVHLSTMIRVITVVKMFYNILICFLPKYQRQNTS